MNKMSQGGVGSKWRENTMNLMFPQKLNDPPMNVACQKKINTVNSAVWIILKTNATTHTEYLVLCSEVWIP